MQAILAGCVVLVLFYASRVDRRRVGSRDRVGALGWILWGAAMSAAMVSQRLSTAMLRRGHERSGAGMILQALAFFAAILLLLIPFVATPWFLAILLALGGSFFNPVLFLVGRDSPWTHRGVLTILNLVAVLGAAYFLMRMGALLARGHVDR